jgi:hypothetical protein
VRKTVDGEGWIVGHVTYFEEGGDLLMSMNLAYGQSVSL